ncbi:MAG: hypothetical protein OQK70_12365 [Gammaproteobacteria bacterium]|nr:hypothetical protein [Gammaproteobacteria bacterium]
MKLIGLTLLTLTLPISAEAYNAPQQRTLEVESQISLPPDPEENGKANLLGFDVDGDGIRDDIKRYLEIRYFDEPKLKAVFLDYALFYLKTISASNQNKEIIQKIAKEPKPASWCLQWLTDQKERDYKPEKTKLKKRIYNTMERYKANMIFHSKLSGTHFKLQKRDRESPCAHYGLGDY